jgi:hypothetical protein
MSRVGSLRGPRSVPWRSRWVPLVLALALGSALVVPGPAARADPNPSVGIGPAAVATSSEAGSNLAALSDGVPTSTRDGLGSSWSAPAHLGAWVQYQWGAPRSVIAVQIYGPAGSGARIKAGLLTFSSGGSLEVGEILADPRFPTTLAFPARSVTWVRFTVTKLSGSGNANLAELRVYPAGVRPLRYPAAPLSALPAERNNPPCVPTRPRTAQAGAIYVRCPQSFSRVRGSRPMHVYAAGLTKIGVTAWSARTGSAALPEVRVTVRSDALSGFTLRLGALPAGPVTVRLRGLAGRSIRSSTPTYFQLYKLDGSIAATPATRPGPGGVGKTLVYAEDFSRPISVSREGRNPGAAYPAGKPEYWGVSEFGQAIFADPGTGYDNLRVVGNRYLRIAVEPNPPGYTDPNGWGRQHQGGIIASARPGGSGFSARYGHFEARILVPSSPGTWPAMWLLPSDNLIEPRSIVAEIDALEHYGHDPRGACHTTHGYAIGRPTAGITLCGRRFATDQQALQWHVYGVTVDPTTITFWIDGKIVARAPQVNGGDRPMFLLLDHSLGGGWPISLEPVQQRAAMYVDWLRVYT